MGRNENGYSNPVNFSLESTKEFDLAIYGLFGLKIMSVQISLRAYFVHGIPMWRQNIESNVEISDVLFITRYLITIPHELPQLVACSGNLAQLKLPAKSDDSFQIDQKQLNFYNDPIPLFLGRHPHSQELRKGYAPFFPYEPGPMGEVFFYWLMARTGFMNSKYVHEPRYHLTPDLDLEHFDLKVDTKSRFFTIPAVQTLIDSKNTIWKNNSDILSFSTGEIPFLSGTILMLHGFDCSGIEELYHEALRRKSAFAGRLDGGLLVVDLAIGGGSEKGINDEISVCDAFLPHPDKAFQ